MSQQLFGAAPAPPVPAPAAWYLRRELLVGAAAVTVVAVIGAVGFTVLGGDPDPLAAGPVAAATVSPTADSTAVTATSGKDKRGNRNPFAGNGAAAGRGAAGSTAGRPAGVSTVVRTVRSVSTTTRTRTATVTTTRTVTTSPTYVYLLGVSGTDGDASFVVNGQARGPIARNGTVVKNLRYKGTQGSTPNLCTKLSWKDGVTQVVCVGAGTRVDD